MTRTLLLRFTSEMDWATVLEALRRKRGKPAPNDGVDPTEAAVLVTALCREFLDAPPAAKNGDTKQ